MSYCTPQKVKENKKEVKKEKFDPFNIERDLKKECIYDKKKFKKDPLSRHHLVSGKKLKILYGILAQLKYRQVLINVLKGLQKGQRDFLLSKNLYDEITSAINFFESTINNRMPNIPVEPETAKNIKVAQRLFYWRA